MMVATFFASALTLLNVISIDQGRRAPDSRGALPARADSRAQSPQTRVPPPETITNSSFEHDKPPLDYFAGRLKEDAGAKLYVFVYGGRETRRGEVRARIRCIRDYMMRQHALDPTRVIIKNGGYRDRLTVELFHRYEDQAEPSPTPTVEPRYVQVIKEGKVKKRC